MYKTILAPLSILFGIGAVLVLMAGTNLFDPVVMFVHTNTIGPMSTGLCFLFTILGFAGCYYLLNILCTYFVPRMEAGQKTTQLPGNNQNMHNDLCKKIIVDNQ